MATFLVLACVFVPAMSGLFAAVDVVDGAANAMDAGDVFRLFFFFLHAVDSADADTGFHFGC